MAITITNHLAACCLSEMASCFINDLPSVFCWISQMASSHISGSIKSSSACRQPHFAELRAYTGYFHFQLVIFSSMTSMLMQSTGQGATHNSQPVHSAAMMVCICLAAPAMASTGQAWMHSVQPMQITHL